MLFSIERVTRSDKGPPDPYRSQSMAIIPEKFHQGNKENGIPSRPPSSSTTTSSGRKPSAEQRKSTSRSSAVRAKSTRPFRDAIRSAVPDTSIISIARRPDQGGKGNRKNSIKDSIFYSSSSSSGTKTKITDQSFLM